MKFQEYFEEALIQEADKVSVQDLINNNEDEVDPIVDEIETTDAPAVQVPGQQEAGKDPVTGSDSGTVEKYKQAQELVNKMDITIRKELEARIEEIDDMVSRLGGLEDNSLLSVLKKGANTNETLDTIYNREHRSIGKASGSLAQLAQNLKSYL